uniref:NACHT domain-containing protein n=1 Tax=Chromera velia CCMP2878 TaxID=1169474 RepID=A0A0K6S7W4_9ALVE|eukprot:Cvel_22649.t2-p1 / transcript=Cvel_22649.t2 / gene=Cvel_22649 / organism=Chromera_velia_CCMP2878 / gene_product=hypothetical protein / transcript_product=hypothetical protein / location=Cvel_scaffold2249:9055-11052(+) / protein_length=467 / sequence_SO=supercontig / SO=protein_coding / is_pseudo=false
MIRSVLHSCRDTLPDIKHLGLASCGLWAPDLSHSIRSGHLRLLETLELDKREFSSGLTTAFTKCLRACFLPHLKNLIFLSGDDSYEDNHDQTSEIIEALKRQDRPPFENVRLTLGSVSEPEARLLGSGALKFIKHLQMDLEAFQLTAFMEALVSAPEEPSLEGLAAGLWVVDGEALGAVRKAILSGGGGQKAERAAFWSAVSEGFRKKNSLSSVCLRGWGWGQAHELGQAAQGGFLSNVKQLTLAEGPFDQSTLFSLCSTVNAMERGLIHLETVDVSRTQVGDGVGFLVESLERGKLPKLIRLLLNDSGITDVCLERFGVAVAGGHMSKIEDLNLSSGSFGPTGIDAFVGAVCAREEGLPQMKHLDLSQRQQQQPGGEWVYGRLSMALQMRKFARLESLNLASVWMHQAAAEEFFGTLRGKNAPMSLRFLNLSGNPIPVVTLSNFVTACSPDTLPNLRQFHLLHIWR